jgi:hypothetical protein
MSSRLQITAGETAPWSMTLTAADGPVDLTTANTVTLTMVDKTGNQTKIDAAACTVEDAAAGLIEYAPNANDVDEPGEYRLQIRAVFASGQVFFFPNGPTPNTVLIARATGS